MHSPVYFEEKNYDHSKFYWGNIEHLDTVRALRRDKSGAVGVDGLSSRLITVALPCVLPILTHIFNFSLIFGIFPFTWKTSSARYLKSEIHWKRVILDPFRSSVRSQRSWNVSWRSRSRATLRRLAFGIPLNRLTEEGILHRRRWSVFLMKLDGPRTWEWLLSQFSSTLQKPLIMSIIPSWLTCLELSAFSVQFYVGSIVICMPEVKSCATR